LPAKALQVQFPPDRIQWLYECSFGQGSTVLAARQDGQKIGQKVLNRAGP
jgi:hypothetical protein